VDFNRIKSTEQALTRRHASFTVMRRKGGLLGYLAKEEPVAQGQVGREGGREGGEEGGGASFAVMRRKSRLLGYLAKEEPVAQGQVRPPSLPPSLPPLGFSSFGLLLFSKKKVTNLPPSLPSSLPSSLAGADPSPGPLRDKRGDIATFTHPPSLPPSLPSWSWPPSWTTAR